MNAAAVRRDFPVLSQTVNGRPLVYLDNAATSQTPRQVIDALVRYYETDNANVHRGIHALSMRASDQYERSRARLALFIGERKAEHVVFTRNATEAINLVAHAWGDRHVGAGDEILLTEMEHHSNIVPWQLLAQRKGARLVYAHIGSDGQLDLDEMRELIGPRTKLVAITHASNVLGTINPVAEIAGMARRVGAPVLLDAAQSAPHLAVDIEALGCDFLALSAHKMLGPTGVGALWAREERLAEMDPFLGGGGMIDRVDEQMSTWAPVPDRYEAGTPSIADAIAFEPAIEYLEQLGMDNVRQHEIELNALAIDRLHSMPGVTIHGPQSPEARAGVVSFALAGVHPHDIATILDTEGVAVRAGHHCAQLVMRRLGVPATTRASFYVYNTAHEIEALVEGLGKVRRVFG
ncbi:MAG: cysteine desulfurase [Dehalococcoidia bacterium]|nr:cysteine desulfurase [Dehalococcoidia bacterium]MCB9484884.1 cysteine desulfurase [Thermoflexaceae bacterium]